MEKLCECGCGQAAPVAKDYYYKGIRPGMPMRFRPGHNSRVNPSMKKSNGVPPEVLYDKEDEDLILSRRWRYAANGYLISQIKRSVDGKKLTTTLFLHRIIANPPPGMVVDHINGDKSDIRRCNLRCVTIAENTQNRTRKNAANKSGYRGVWYNAERGKYEAKATVSGVMRHLGRYDTAEEANAVVVDFRRKHMPGYIDHAAASTGDSASYTLPANSARPS